MNKLKYDYRTYTPQLGDAYNPALSGVASFFIPGLGQMVSGEVGRGFAFLGGTTACAIMMSVGTAQLATSNINNFNNDNNSVSTKGTGKILLGAVGMLAIDIWAIVDAVHVAKVNNMYLQDLRNTSKIDFQLSPYMETISLGDNVVTPVGLSLKVNF